MDEMDLSQFKEVFISESKEHLVALNAALVELEKKPDNRDVLNDIFRVAHTLKGMSATMGYDRITGLTHHMEDVLDQLRKGEVAARGNAVDVIFECLDALESLVGEIESGTEAAVDIDRLMARLSGLIDGSVEAAPEATAGVERAESRLAPAVSSPGPAGPADGPFAETPKAGTDEAAAAPGASKKARTSIRINISYLDTMMNLVGEMVISKSQLEQIAIERQMDDLKGTLEQLDRIAVDLQEAVLRTRMVPLSQIFDRYPRMVRDLALRLGKEVEFEITGADIEVDRMLLEEINEPLVHLLRNALDHGIEAPPARASAGKERTGKVTLSARRERGCISIQVTDDGKGLDPAVLRAKAIERGIVTPEAAGVLAADDTYQLVCDPRFSTAEKVTDISGRGVGMDVVKTAIESFNGRLVIDSKTGAGSSFAVNLPLSIAIISALLVKVGVETYAIPLNNITEVVPFAREDVKSIEKREVVVLRDEVLPLVYLERALGVAEARRAAADSTKFILRVEAGTKLVGLVVDDFVGRKEIVIKALSGLAKRAKGFSGATILGDGSVVLIIDINSLIQ